MKPRAAAFPLLLLSILVALAGLVPGCGSNDKGTNVVQISETFDSGDLHNVNDTFVHTFPTAGTFPYRCKNHAGMTGTVSVVAGSADSVIVHITNNLFSGDSPIKPGGYVRWNMDVAGHHTVTRP